MRVPFLAAFLLPASILFAQGNLDKVRSHRMKNEASIYSEFIAFLQLPNVATDITDIRKNAAFLMDMMKQRGVDNIQLLDAGDQNIPPAVYGDVKVAGATKTLVFYAHYDGQPVNPATWAKNLHPFRPQLLSGRHDENASAVAPAFPLNDNWRIYARGSSDDKAGVLAILNAYTAIKASGIPFPYNIKFFFDGEEELGSPHLPQILEKHRSLLQSDLWIICDGPVHQSGYKQIVYVVRGDTHLTLKVYGPKNPLHSGHYGNWAPNPVMNLTRLLASMKDENGQVLVKGFYDDVTPLSPLEKKSLASVPDVETALKKQIGFVQEDMKGKTLNEAINLPSLNINGIESSNTGTITANVIPVSATAVLDLRLVMGNDWSRQQQKVIDHIVQQGYYITEKAPTDGERMKHPKLVQVTRGVGSNAQRTSMDWPLAQQVAAAVQQTTSDPVLQIPTLGGTLPVDDLVNVLKAKFLIVPIANYDNNQHAENENIRIGHFREGIDIIASIMLMKL